MLAANGVRKIAWMVAGLLLAGLPGTGRPRALGDVVHLEGGKVLEGTVTPGAAPGTLEVRTGDGVVVVLQESQVLRVDKQESPLETFQGRLAALPPGELEPLEDLLVWAIDKRLRAGTREVARRILRIDPNHAQARRELGEVVFQNRWVREADLRKQRGLVRHGGEWMTEAERDRRLEAEALREVEELFGLVGSGNAHLQEFAFRKLLAHAKPGARGAFASRLGDPEDAVRLVAVRCLAELRGDGPGDADGARIAADLHRALLSETNEKGLPIYAHAVARFYPRESLRWALRTLGEEAPGRTPEANAALALRSILRLHPELFEEAAAALPAPAAPAGGPGQGVRRALASLLGADLGPDPRAWVAAWREARR